MEEKKTEKGEKNISSELFDELTKTIQIEPKPKNEKEKRLFFDGRQYSVRIPKND